MLRMVRSSILMRAVRAEADDVLEDELVIGLRPNLVQIVLQAETAELACRVVDHAGIAARCRTEIVERRPGEAWAEAVRVHLVITQADAPLRHELIDALRIEAGACGGEMRTRIEETLLLLQEELRLELQIALDEIAVGRPFVDGVGNIGVVGAAEEVGSGKTRCRAVLGT